MKATAVGPASWPSKASTPASLAAIAVSVFFTTAYVAWLPMLTKLAQLRHGQAAVLGQHSGIRRTELVRDLSYRGSLVGPCHGTPSWWCRCGPAHRNERPGAGAHGAGLIDQHEEESAALGTPAQVARWSGTFDLPEG